MTDELRDALSAAFDKVEGTPDAGTDTVAAEGPTPSVQSDSPDDGPAGSGNAADRARDEQGRFAKAEEAKKERETLTLKGKPNAAKEQERPAEGSQTAAKQGSADQPGLGKQGAQADVSQQPGANRPGDQTPVLPPAHWVGNGKVSWEKLPYPVKQAIAQDYQQFEPLRAIAPAIQQYAPLLQQRYGGNVSQGVASVLQLYDNAVNRPVDFIRDFCQQFNIDPQSLAGRPADPSQGQAEAEPWQQELAAVKGQLQALAQQPLIAQQTQIQTEVESFSRQTNTDGSLAHPYYNDVKPLMAALFTSGQARTLQEAYDQACYANPQIRQSLMAMEAQRQADERRRAADTAKQAAATVTGAPGHRGPGTPQSETVGDTLMRNYEKALSGARA